MTERTTESEITFAHPFGHRLRRRSIPANIETYKAGAKAFGDAGKGKATNPHPPETARARTWDNGYLDGQKLSANRDGELSRKRATLHLPKIKD